MPPEQRPLGKRSVGSPRQRGRSLSMRMGFVFKGPKLRHGCFESSSRGKSSGYRVTALVLCEKIVRVPLMFDAVMRTRMNRETSVETGT